MHSSWRTRAAAVSGIDVQRGVAMWCLWQACPIERPAEKGEKSINLSMLKNSNVRKLLDDVLTWKFDIMTLEHYCKLQYALHSLSPCSSTNSVLSLKFYDLRYEKSNVH